MPTCGSGGSNRIASHSRPHAAAQKRTSPQPGEEVSRIHPSAKSDVQVHYATLSVKEVGTGDNIQVCSLEHQ